MPKNLKGGGAQFKSMPAGSDRFSLSKKKVITSPDVQFSAQSQVKSKKSHHALRLSFIPTYTYTTKVLCFCLGGGGGGGAVPAAPWICPCKDNAEAI